MSDLHILAGDEPLALAEHLDALRAQAKQNGIHERLSWTVEGRKFDWSSLVLATQNMGLFGERRLLEIHLPNGSPGVQGANVLKALASNSPDMLIVVLPKLNKTIKDSDWYVALSAKTKPIICDPVPVTDIPDWLKMRLKHQGQEVSHVALSFMAHQVEGNLLAAHQEVQKLGLIYPRGLISDDDVRAALLNVARHDAFQLSEAVLAGDVVRTTRILQNLHAEGEQPATILPLLLWGLRPLPHLKRVLENGGNLSKALLEQRIFGDKQSLVKAALGRFSLRQLDAMLERLADIDRMAKGVLDGNASLEIAKMCVGLAKIRPRRKTT